MSEQTLITTPCGFDSTAAEVVADIDLGGKRAIVTGSSSGIGIETARAFAGAGADVTLAVRDFAAGARTAAEITATTDNRAVEVAELDLARPDSVAAFVTRWSGPLDLLSNNAGVMAVPDLRLTPQGWELQFATNHLGHFALAVGLHDALATAPGARMYLFKADQGTKTACTGACAGAWPPLLVTGKPTVGSGVNASLLGTTTRPEGTTQLTYNGHPLYLFARDQKAGETNGQGVSAFGAAWFALNSAGNQVSAQPSSSNTSGGGGLGY